MKSLIEDGLKKEDIPIEFNDREFLKFIYGCNNKLPVAKALIQKHFKWRLTYLPCKLTSNMLMLIV
jgi:hypothetical protein